MAARRRRSKGGDKGGGPEVDTPKDLAKACGVQTRTAQRWVKLKGFPGGPKGPWNIAEVLAWSKARRSRSANRAEPDPTPDQEQRFLPFQIAAVEAALRPLLTEKKIPKEMFDAAMASIRDPTATERYRMAKAELAELDLRKRRSELVERSRVLELLVKRAGDLKRLLLNLPRTLATLLQGKRERQIQTILQEEIERALDQFVRKQGLEDLIEDDAAA